MGDLKMKSEKRNCCQMLAGTLLGYLGYSSPMTWQGALRAWQQFHFSLFIFMSPLDLLWQLFQSFLVNYNATYCDPAINPATKSGKFPRLCSNMI